VSIVASILLAVFRQGDLGLNWYAVLGGQLEVRQEQPSKDSTQKVRWYILSFSPSSACSLTATSTVFTTFPSLIEIKPLYLLRFPA
jgi:hypothetical protein